MHKLMTARFALPTIVVLAIVTIAIITCVLLSHHVFGGTAWGFGNG